MMCRDFFVRSRRSLRLACLLAVLVPALVRAQLSVRWDPLLEPGCEGWSVCNEVSPFNSNWILTGGDCLGSALSTDGGWNWQGTIGFLDWELGDFTWHPTIPTTVWAGTLGGPYESTDGGHTWTSMRSGMPSATQSYCTAPIQKILFDPNNSSRLLAFGGNQRDFITPTNGTTCYGAIWQSINGGTSWSKLLTLSTTGTTTSVTGVNIRNAAYAAGSSTTVYACSADGNADVYIITINTTNNTATAVLANSGIPTSAHAQNIVVHPTNPSIAWVSLDGGNGIYKTTNGGASSSASNSGLTLDSSVYIQPLAIAPSNGNVLYCAAQASTSQNADTYSSTNGGSTWTKIVNNGTNLSTIVGGIANTPGEVLEFKFLSVDPNDATHVLGNTEGLLLESWNSGVTWHDMASFTANSQKRGTGYSGFSGFNIKWNPYKRGNFYPNGGDSAKTLRSVDFGYSYQIGSGGLNVWNGSYDTGFSSSGVIYLGTGQNGNTLNEAILKSINGGSTFSYISRPSGANGSNVGIYVLPSDPTGNTMYSVVSDLTYFVNPNGVIYKTTNGGSTWTTLLTTTDIMYSIDADPVNYNTIYVASASGIYKSTDGTAFTLLPGLPNPMTQLWDNVHVDPTNSSNLFAVGFRYGKVGHYTGGTWTQIFNKTAAVDIAVDPNNNQRMAVITHGYPGDDLNQADGVWISTNGGGTWNPYNTGLRMLSGFKIHFNPDKSGQLVLATDCGGFYVTDLGTSTPYSGNVINIAGTGSTTIQAENYDAGGQNVAYYHSTPGNRGGDNYRTDNVDIKAEGTGHAISNMVAGEWLKYSVNVPFTGYYDISLNVMSTTSGGQFHIDMNGVNVTGPVAIGSTGGVWKNITARGVRLIAGNQFMKVYCEAAGADLDFISTALSTNGIGITYVSTGAAYDVTMSSLGARAHIDQPYLVSVLSPNLQNLPMIQTAMGDAGTTTATNLTFTLDQPGTVYVALDTRLTTRPAFLNGWTTTTESAGINNSTSSAYNVYSQHFSAGSVTLGGNIQSPASGSANMYMVFIKRD